MWRLRGIDPLRAGPSFGPPPALITFFLLLAFHPACAHAVPHDATAESDSSDAGQSAYADGRFIDALRIWRPRAEQGDARAAFGLGLLYDLGEGVGQDAAAAYGWYRRAAETGYVLAEFNLGVMCDSGVGTGRNATEAALWYARAAAHGYARAEYNLAQLYETGDGVPRNLDMATSWYAAAAAHGLSAAAHKVTSLREERQAAVSSYAAKPTGPPDQVASLREERHGSSIVLCGKSDAGPGNPNRTIRRFGIGDRRERPGRAILGCAGGAFASRLFRASSCTRHGRRPSSCLHQLFKTLGSARVAATRPH